MLLIEVSLNQNLLDNFLQPIGNDKQTSNDSKTRTNSILRFDNALSFK